MRYSIHIFPKTPTLQPCLIQASLTHRTNVLLTSYMYANNFYPLNNLKGTKGIPKISLIKKESDFPGGTVVKNPPANAGNTGSSPGPGRSHMPWGN